MGPFLLNNEVEDVQMLRELTTRVLLIAAVTLFSGAGRSNDSEPLFEGRTAAEVCGFASMAEFNQEVERVFQTFTSIEDFDHFFWEPNPSLKLELVEKTKQQIEELKKREPHESASLPFAASLFLIRNELATRAELKPFEKIGYVQLDLTSTCSFACDQGVFVGINSAFTGELFKKYSDIFKSMMAFVIAHEVGHKIFDGSLWYSKTFSSIDEYRKYYETLEYGKLHLTVDGIGMRLTNTPAVEAAKFLEKTVEAAGVPAGTGDFAKRAFCLRNLK
jgi:hypothetical protein